MCDSDHQLLIAERVSKFYKERDEFECPDCGIKIRYALFGAVVQYPEDSMIDQYNSSVNDKMVIRAELNFLQKLLYEIYVGKEEFTILNWTTINKRIQSIRDRVAE